VQARFAAAHTDAEWLAASYDSFRFHAKREGSCSQVYRDAAQYLVDRAIEADETRAGRIAERVLAAQTAEAQLAAAFDSFRRAVSRVDSDARRGRMQRDAGSYLGRLAAPPVPAR
jgi:hypothetical protein